VATRTEPAERLWRDKEKLDRILELLTDLHGRPLPDTAPPTQLLIPIAGHRLIMFPQPCPWAGEDLRPQQDSWRAALGNFGFHQLSVDIRRGPPNSLDMIFSLDGFGIRSPIFHWEVFV
jgi:hypothetical protein